MRAWVAVRRLQPRPGRPGSQTTRPSAGVGERETLLMCLREMCLTLCLPPPPYKRLARQGKQRLSVTFVHSLSASSILLSRTRVTTSFPLRVT
ncbi:hypothetical protein R1flu_013179 [Riccia fluitans]|uniref:Uncharacterized protein n=1 Tax=Riccia fluitans TaxID=41844 RepID=A0ABD1XDN2_9MARC